MRLGRYTSRWQLNPTAREMPLHRETIFMFVQTHHTTGSSCFQSITFPWWALILLAFTAAVHAEWTALDEAIDKDDVTAARRAIEQGATFNTLEVWQDALSRSAPDEMFALFLEKGFDPHMRPGDSASPLYAAAAKGPKHDGTIYDTQKLLIGRDDSEAARTRQLLKWHRENPMPIEESEGEH
jgi:hypothetical protein